MLRTVLGLSVLVSMSACQYNKEGVFLATIPLADDVICDTTISENITDSDPPDDITTTVSDWVFTETATQSDALVFIQIFENRTGEVLVDFAGTLYPGTRDGKVITVEWVNSNVSQETAENNNAGYRYFESDDSKVTNTITFTKNKDTKGYSAVWKSNSSVQARAEENDEWDPMYGPYSGDINTWIFTYLYGTGSNSADQVDCDSDPCFIQISDVCNGSLNFEVVETDLDPEAYEGIKNSGQPNGLF